jgi:4a-hydroxytetrahydrobiopterin dehydratase
MGETITAQQFHDADGVEDWRVLAYGVSAYFRTKSFAVGVKFVDAIGELADAANHHPDIDLRYAGVTVRMLSHDVLELTDRDLELAQQISVAARELDIAADPTRVQDVFLTIDALDIPLVMPFWRAVLGYKQVGDEDLVDPRWRAAPIWFQQMDEPRTQRNRIHVDIRVPHDQAEARVAAAIEAGGHLVSDKFAPAWWTLADAEGNEADVATWMGRDWPV